MKQGATLIDLRQAPAFAQGYASGALNIGYGPKVGLAAGLLLSVIGAVIFLLWPARRDSRWKLQGPFGSGGGKTVAEARAEHDQESE